MSVYTILLIIGSSLILFGLSGYIIIETKEQDENLWGIKMGELFCYTAIFLCIVFLAYLSTFPPEGRV